MTGLFNMQDRNERCTERFIWKTKGQRTLGKTRNKWKGLKLIL